jgi:hypothetical protein
MVEVQDFITLLARAAKNQQEIKLLVDSITGTRICQPIKRQKIYATNRTSAVVVGVARYRPS